MQRQQTASPSDLPVGAVAVAPSQPAARSSLPSSDSLDAHAHAELHSAPMQSTPPVEQMSLSQQHAVPSTDQAKVQGVTTHQAGASASISDHTEVLQSTSTPHVEASQPPSATSALDITANLAFSAPANHEAAVAVVQALPVQTTEDEHRHSTRDRSINAAEGSSSDAQDSAELLVDNAKTALHNQEGNRPEARGFGRLENEYANQYGHKKRKTCDS